MNIVNKAKVRAWNYESKNLHNPNNRFIQDMRADKYGRMDIKKQAMLEIGLNYFEMMDKEMMGYNTRKELEQPLTDIEEQERNNKIEMSKYNKLYKEILPEGKSATYLPEWKGSRREKE